MEHIVTSCFLKVSLLLISSHSASSSSTVARGSCIRSLISRTSFFSLDPDARLRKMLNVSNWAAFMLSTFRFNWKTVKEMEMNVSYHRMPFLIDTQCRNTNEVLKLSQQTLIFEKSPSLLSCWRRSSCFFNLLHLIFNQKDDFPQMSSKLFESIIVQYLQHLSLQGINSYYYYIF